MSFLFRTKGVVLSYRHFREVDRWYSMLTQEHGKIEFLARGGNKPLAKLTSHLEMAAEVDVLLVRGRVYHTIAGVERIRAFPLIQQNLQNLLLIQNAFSLIDIATKQNERDPALYQLLITWLEFLNSCIQITDERAAYLLGSFMLKLMAISGYRPELSRCVSCNREIEPNSYLWHALKGGVVCQACFILNKDQWFNVRPMEDSTLKLLRFAMCESFNDQIKPKLQIEHIKTFHEALESFVVCHFPTIPPISLRAACAIS